MGFGSAIWTAWSVFPTSCRNLLTSHGLFLGKTRSGKSFLALLLIQEALRLGGAVKVFDPHVTLVKRLTEHPNLKKRFTRGAADIPAALQGYLRRSLRVDGDQHLKAAGGAE